MLAPSGYPSGPMSTSRPDWSTASWREYPCPQQPSYGDREALARVLGEISALPPLVTSYEIERLRGQVAEAARGERFILWGGDCAESFADCTSAAIAAKLKILLQMSLVLVHGTRRRVTRIGRFAGQYAKPRSAPTETRDGVELPSYRGDNVNRPEFDRVARTPDPALLLRGYERSALTLNFIRALVDGGFADLHHPENWDLGFVRNAPLAAEYQRMVDAIGESLRFTETLAGAPIATMRRVDFYTSHEMLVLDYEAALTRTVPRRAGWFNLSTHLPWIGLRTSSPDGAVSGPTLRPTGFRIPRQNSTCAPCAFCRRRTSPARSSSPRGSAPAASARRCRRSSGRCATRPSRSRGSRIRCTETPRPWCPRRARGRGSP